MSSHPKLRWKRSDGSADRWPSAKEQVASTRNSWYEKLEVNDAKYELYNTKLGAFLAEQVGLPKKPTLGGAYSIPLPEGYALFGHNKPQDDGKLRTDVYLFGSKVVLKFRSPAEFFEHAAWLQDESRSLGDHSTCGCKYNNSSDLALQKKSSHVSLPQSSSASSSKRPAAQSSPAGKRPRRSSETSSIDDSSDVRPAVIPERELDLTTHRRFRRGELVWFRIEPISPPPHRSDLPTLTHWPGLISIIRPKTKIIDDPVESPSVHLGENGAVPRASLLAAWSIAGGPTPPELSKTGQRAVKYFEHSLRPLGLFDANDEIAADVQDLLPWAVGNELLGGQEGWDLLGKECTRIMTEGAIEEARNLMAKGANASSSEEELSKMWRDRWARRVPFNGFSTEWTLRVSRIGVAMKTAASIAASWTITDRIYQIPLDEMAPEDRKAIMAEEKKLYQGLWWGGERIWLGDMVRLRKKRSDLPVGDMVKPSEGAEERGVVMNIKAISLEPSKNRLNNVQPCWCCLFFGDAYELALPSSDTISGVPSTGIEGEIALGEPHIPVKGFEYRQLHSSGSEVCVDVMDVAGRVYPDLIDPKTQRWFVPPGTDDVPKDRAVAGGPALALCGLRPGTVVSSKSEQFRQDLYTIVSESTKATEDQMRKWYEGLLRSEFKKAGLTGASTNGQAQGHGTVEGMKSEVPINLNEAMGGNGRAVAA